MHERMEEHSRRRGAQQGAEGRPAGRVVGAVFLMTISWAVSPHPHRVAHFKYHEVGILLLSLQVGQFVLVCVRASRWLGPPGLRFLSPVKARASTSWARSPRL